jgi:hypothetical protein
VEAVLNNSTVAPLDVGGDEKRTDCRGLYLGYPVSGLYKYGNLPLQIESLKSETVKYDEFHGTRTLE